MFARFVFLIIGERPVGSLSVEEIRKIIAPLWSGSGSIGYLLRQNLDFVFRWAVAQGHRSDNPVDTLTMSFPTVKRTVRHHPSLPYWQVPEAVAVIRASVADPALKLMVVFIVLCASRFGEAAGARWSEIDRKERLWTLPRELMKARNEHRVPLSVQTLRVLDEVRALKRSKSLVFATSSGRPVSSSAASRFLRSFDFVDGKGRRVVLHGFRRTFALWSLEVERARPEMVHAAVRRVPSDPTLLACAPPDPFEDRVAIMQHWADYVLPRKSSGKGERC